MNIFIRWLINAVAIMIAAYLLPGVAINGFGSALVVALVLGLLNVFFKPLLVLLTLPLTIITLGLFTFVINALLILLADQLVAGFAVANFWWALVFSLVLSIVSALLHSLGNEATSPATPAV